MTDRQKKFIQKMCEVLDYDFFELRNMSVKEANDWINENINDYNYAIGELQYD